MSQIGSFALLLALAVGAYWFPVGLLTCTSVAIRLATLPRGPAQRREGALETITLRTFQASIDKLNANVDRQSARRDSVFTAIAQK
jgi:hypothetical protein